MRPNRLIPMFALLAAGLAAHADTYQFSFGSAASTFAGSGFLTTGSSIAPGEFYIESISGTTRIVANGPDLTITSLLDPDTFPTPTNGGTLPANDNVLFVQNGLGRPDERGFSFLLNDGAQVNLFNDGPGVNSFLLSANGTPFSETAPLSITPVSATPEPSSLALLFTGLLGCAARFRRRSA